MNAGGLAQWPAKFLIPAGFFLLFVQGISEIIKRIAVMRGLMPDPHEAGGPHAHAGPEQEHAA
jgi:TRAP-type mannitol/chloroaromatic compound transport system permease small subunit